MATATSGQESARARATRASRGSRGEAHRAASLDGALLPVPEPALSGYLALFDGPTKLPGWPLLLDRATVAFERARRTQGLVALFAVDHVEWAPLASPDWHALGRWLATRVRSDDTVAWIEPDLLAVLCCDLRTAHNADHIAFRLAPADAPVRGYRLRMGVAAPDQDLTVLFGPIAARLRPEPLAHTEPDAG